MVKEYEPPEPTPYDPYPGYYELPSGEWRAYDPAYYKSHWETWQAQYSTSADIKGKGKDGRGWEGADNDDMTAVNADEEMRNSQLAERERQKGLTAPPTIVQGEAPKVKVRSIVSGCRPDSGSDKRMIFSNSKRMVSPRVAISCRHSFRRRMRIGVRLRRRSLKADGTGRRPGTNTVRCRF